MFDFSKQTEFFHWGSSIQQKKKKEKKKKTNPPSDTRPHFWTSGSLLPSWDLSPKVFY